MDFGIETTNRFLFNFAASYGGGGYKRLYEYAKWFNHNGGAWFIIHPRCGSLIAEFHNNRFVLATQPRYTRIFWDCEYLDGIERQIGEPDLYYSYGIPIYSKFGRINWFHVSNVLPLHSRGIPLTLFDRVKYPYLGRRIKRNYRHADVISAESNFSLSLVDADESDKLFLSVNGSDDELAFVPSTLSSGKENIATVVGTMSYKGLEDSYRVFQMLRKTNNQLRLVIIGNEEPVPQKLKDNGKIALKGNMKRSDVIENLRRTKYYISTTHIENSYNAACEGVFFADESYISDIGPHRELLRNMPFRKVIVPNVSRPLLHVTRDNISTRHLKSWEQVIVDMMEHIRLKLGELPLNPH